MKSVSLWKVWVFVLCCSIKICIKCQNFLSLKIKVFIYSKQNELNQLTYHTLVSWPLIGVLQTRSGKAWHKFRGHTSHHPAPCQWGCKSFALHDLVWMEFWPPGGMCSWLEITVGLTGKQSGLLYSTSNKPAASSGSNSSGTRGGGGGDDGGGVSVYLCCPAAR